MKKSSHLLLLCLVAISIVLSSCGSKEVGQLYGVPDRPKWKGINPYGMVYIPSGYLHVGQSSNDIFSRANNRSTSITIDGFFMDDTQITNNEYRQFVNWVRDSIAHVYLDHFTEDEYGNSKIDWSYEIDYSDEELNGMFFRDNEVLFGKREMDKSKLIYKYKWMDLKKAALNPDIPRSQLISEESTAIYPDTLVWIRDFAYSYNEPFARNYFWHPAFDDYPVVGVNWNMAKAFTYWRTHIWNAYMKDQPNTENFRLPTEWEFEYAARGGHDMMPYPWGGYYTRNSKGCLLANFKPGRGDYREDGAAKTINAYAYDPNDYGLYNMAGNVSEWTITSFQENAYEFMHDMNPDIKYTAKADDNEAYKRKVIRGGSWKDIAYYIQNGTRSWEYQDTAKSYIGFRCVLTYLGRTLDD